MCAVSDCAQRWCISWKFWIPCCFHNEVVMDCAVVVDSWLLYRGGWYPTMMWGRKLEVHKSMCGLNFQVVDL